MKTASRDTDFPQPTSNPLNENLQGGAQNRSLFVRGTDDADAISLAHSCTPSRCRAGYMFQPLRDKDHTTSHVLTVTSGLKLCSTLLKEKEWLTL